MSFSKRRFSLRHPAVVDVGCSCRRSKLYSLFSSSSKPPKPNSHTPPKHHHPLSSYYPFCPSTTTFSTTTNLTTTSASSPSPPPYKPLHVAKESVAIFKESQDPYNDFRNSMLQMILEKQIYAVDDLRNLLHLFLSLNSPVHHDAILRAFSEIWNDIFSSSSSAQTKRYCHRSHHQHHRRRRRHARDVYV